MGNFYDALVMLVLAFELVLGFLDGFWVRFLRLLGLVLAVVLSAVLTGPFCQALLSFFPVTSIKVGLICWLFIFSTVALACWLLVRWAEHAQDRRRGKGLLSVTSHVFGSLVGLLHGILLVLVVTWGYSLFRVHFTPRAPSFEAARLMPLAERANEAAAFAAIYPSVEPEALARRVAWQLGHPGRTVEVWHSLLQQESFQALLDSPSFWQSVFTGDEWGIQSCASFQDLLHDKAAMRALRLLVLPVKDYEQKDEQRFFAERLAGLGRTYEQMQDHPKVKDLVESLQRDQMFRTGERAALVEDMRFVRLLAKIMREAAPGGE